MNTSKYEFLSALLDDEAGAFEQRRLLTELQQDAELGQTFSRYALIGEVMRTKTTPANKDFLAGIQAALDDEPNYDMVVESAKAVGAAAVKTHSVRDNTSTPRKAPVWRYALAASAVLAVVGGVWVLQTPTRIPVVATLDTAANAPQSEPDATALVQSTQSTQPVSAEATELENRQTSHLDPKTRDLIRQYMAQHVKYASTTAIVPSVRAISYSNDY